MMIARRVIKSAGINDFQLNLNQTNTMKLTNYYQSHLLYRRSYKPARVLRIRPVARITRVFRPVHRFGVKPRLEQE